MAVVPRETPPEATVAVSFRRVAGMVEKGRKAELLDGAEEKEKVPNECVRILLENPG